MHLHLAPMEGVIDHHVRQLLTGLGGLDSCVTEFVRVCEHQRLPARVFKKLCPELEHKSLTPTGVPVIVQLLGGHPGALAYNAEKAALLGAAGIDLNFGCPAKTVNRNDGGACLLREPERVYRIVSEVRKRVPSHIPVSAKIRLGFEDRSRYLDNALAVQDGGANRITVHARSKADGYRPPAYWHYIGDINATLSIPVIANGEIWSEADFERCREQSGCSEFMLGRGILSRPDLALAIRASISGDGYQQMTWQTVCDLLFHYYLITKQAYPAKHLGNRVKQWLAYLRRHYQQADALFENIKREKDAEAFERKFYDAGATDARRTANAC